MKEVCIGSCIASALRNHRQGSLGQDSRKQAKGQLVCCLTSAGYSESMSVAVAISIRMKEKKALTVPEEDYHQITEKDKKVAVIS